MACVQVCFTKIILFNKHPIQCETFVIPQKFSCYANYFWVDYKAQLGLAAA
eukprot:TRINITY_DN964_c0_g5_i1.p1 TRINITY_DN964_c0_g5~~TRINITY_DN964_c0_g5_i1.p1  ORF type:complete len:51 (+),score=1.02 TRINITY_DN964_c0_g5_i1:404-556(+)